MHDVEADWCHNGSIHHESWDKTPGETNDHFAERVGKLLTAALKANPVTNDC